MLTGRQLRQARALLGLQRSKLAERVRLPRAIVKIAESVDGECPITVARARQVQAYLEGLGIEFLSEDDEPTARLRERAPHVQSLDVPDARLAAGGDEGQPEPGAASAPVHAVAGLMAGAAPWSADMLAGNF